MGPTASTQRNSERVSIRPGISILSVLRHLNYKQWFAMAEFVDNSIQSFLDYRTQLAEQHVSKVRVSIELDPDGSRIVIRDNAAGIHESDFPRAFRPAAIPPDRDGLAEFGMGMKSAACWFSPRWTVRTSALGEPVERTVQFDIDLIVRDELEELAVHSEPASADSHYTEVVLEDLYHPLRGRTIGKIKEHLASIYRIFQRNQILDLLLDSQLLQFVEPPILVAPYYQDPDGDAVLWRKDIDFDFGDNQRIHGFAGLRQTASTSEAGFALFRRDRLIEGSADDSYRPSQIFGASNSYTYQRLFGELNLEGFEVSHTKDGFQWDEDEEVVLDLLREHLDAPPLRLISQAEGHRVRIRTTDVRSGATVAVERTGDAIEHGAPAVIESQLTETPESADTPTELPPAELASHRTINLDLDGQSWQIELELSTDPAVGDWVFLSDQPGPASSSPRRLGVRVSLAHPFMERFGGILPSQIEPLLRVAVALVLAEVTAREAGLRLAGSIRKRVNDLLRNALSRP